MMEHILVLMCFATATAAFLDIFGSKTIASKHVGRGNLGQTKRQ